MPLTLVGADDPEEPGRPWPPATLALHDFADIQRVLAVAAGRPVLLVLPADRALARRLLDVASGWSYGTGFRLSKVADHTFLLAPAGTELPEPVRRQLDRVARSGAPGTDLLAPAPIEPDDEELLRLAAGAGDADAHRRLVDAHAELAAVVATILRPQHVSPSEALRIAQRELGAAIAADARRPLLVTLVDRIAAALGR